MKNIRSFEPFWGDWYIERELGHGSYGTVYLARKKDPKRIYYAAIKHIPIPADERDTKALYDGGYITDHATVQAYYEQMVSSMMAEIDACYALKGHTNIVSYEEHNIVPRVGEPGFDIFIKMEYLTPLSDYIIGRALTVGDVVRMGEDICTALTVLQRKQFVHRDVKPGNVFINDVGNFKLGDFGVARTMERTMSGMSEKGTYEFMAPEVRQGGEAGYQVDIYSLGIMMYKLLNGNRSPFLPLPPTVPTFGQSEEARQRRFSGEALPPPAHGGEVLGEIVLKACAFHQEERWADAAEMKNALSAYCEALTKEQADETVLYYEQSSRELSGTAGGDAPTELLTGMIDADATAILPPGTPLDDEPTPRTDAALPAEPKRVEGTPKKPRKLALIAGVAAVVVIGIVVGVFALSNPKPAEIVETPMPSPIETPTPTPTPTETGPVEIAWVEPAVEVAVREYLGRAEGAVFREDLKDIKKVAIFGQEPEADVATTIREENDLVIVMDDGFSLKDFAWFSNSGITELHIEGTIGADDYAPLSELAGLTKLDLGRPKSGDLTPIGGLADLTELTLGGSEVADVTPLGKLTRLTSLTINDCPKLSDLTPLSNLTNLSKLHLCSDRISNLAPISGLIGLTELNLSTNQISDLTPLTGLVKLTDLDISSNLVENVSPLGGLTSLTALNLMVNQISDISPLAGLDKNCCIWTGETLVTDWSSLKEFPNIVGRKEEEPPVVQPKPSQSPKPKPSQSPKPSRTPKPPPPAQSIEPSVIVVTGVSISPGSVILQQGGIQRLGVTVTPEDASDKSVSWSSSNSAVASVDGSGNVSAKGSGTAIITASCGGYQGSCAVTVE